MNTIIIRPAVPEDAQAFLDIYGPCVTSTNITFEYEIPSREEFKNRITHTLSMYPWYAAISDDGRTAGYAYGSPQGTRAAYQWNAQVSVYIHPDFRRERVGSALYAALLATLSAQGFYTAYAIISYPNPASEAFHSREGFTALGIHPATGFKRETWVDVLYMEKILRAREGIPERPVSYPLLDKSRIAPSSANLRTADEFSFKFALL